MREHMRTSDRALSNIEALPEGFNALRRLHEQIQVGWVGGWVRGWAGGWVRGWVGGWVEAWAGAWVGGWAGG